MARWLHRKWLPGREAVRISSQATRICSGWMSVLSYRRGSTVRSHLRTNCTLLAHAALVKPSNGRFLGLRAPSRPTASSRAGDRRKPSATHHYGLADLHMTDDTRSDKAEGKCMDENRVPQPFTRTDTIPIPSAGMPGNRGGSRWRSDGEVRYA